MSAGIIGFIVGAVIGALVVLFIVGASKLNYENEIYMEGYLAGQVEAMKEGGRNEM